MEAAKYFIHGNMMQYASNLLNNNSNKITVTATVIAMQHNTVITIIRVSYTTNVYYL